MGVHAVEEIIRIALGRTELSGSEESRNCAVKMISARLRHDQRNAAVRSAVLRLQSAGLYLNALDEGEVDACSNRSVVWAEDAQAAVTDVGEIHAVDDVLILQAGCATDGWICCSGAAAVDCAWRGIKQASHISRHGDLLIEGVIQVAADGG